MTYTFNHWGMEKKGNEFEFTRSWNWLLKYKVTKKFILIYTSQFNAEIIQKRMFNNNAELEDFILFIEERLSKN